MDLEVEKLLRKGAIEEVEPCENQFLSNIFTIPKKGGERRPVVDMRDLNNFIEPVHFKMEDLSHLPSLLRRGDFICKIDLKDAYQTIPIAKKSRIYLRFLWRGRLYQFKCLPFGLRSSPRIFTKVLKPLLVYLRALGVRLLVYLDDILIMAATPELCLEHTQLTWQLLTDLGFLGNLKKSVLAPKQQAEYLGFIVNSIEIKLSLMEEKLLRAKLEAERLLKSNPVAKILASFLGFCQSTLPAIAVAPLHFRNLQADMIKALKGSRGGQGYRSVVCLSPEAKKELEWWRDYVKMNNGKSILPPEEQDTIFSDASKQGRGGTSESSKNRGSMELGGKVKITHKLARVKSSFPGFASFSSPTKISACSDWHRQQNSNDLYQQIRGNPFTSSHISSLRDVELCSRQKPDFVSSVCSRRGKPDCRQKVKGVPGQPGMDAASSGVSGITKRSWLFQYRSLCNTGEPSGSCICQLETRAWGSCHRCFQCKMGFSTGLPVPSLLYDQRCLRKIQQDQAHCVLITPVWKSSPWYPVILSLLVGQPLLLPRRLDLLRLPGTEKIHPL